MSFIHPKKVIPSFHFVTDHLNTTAVDALAYLAQRYTEDPAPHAPRLIVFGGDGFMLKVLRTHIGKYKDFYGINCGTVGFLMNKAPEPDANIPAILENAKKSPLTLLNVQVEHNDHTTSSYIAINDISLLRSSPQAIELEVTVNGTVQIPSLMGDGILIATSTGSTAYNRSLNGPILPPETPLLSILPISPAIRWSGALIHQTATICIRLLNKEKRPALLSIDDLGITQINTITITQAMKPKVNLLFDPTHHLDNRILEEQFKIY